MVTQRIGAERELESQGRPWWKGAALVAAAFSFAGASSGQQMGEIDPEPYQPDTLGVFSSYTSYYRLHLNHSLPANVRRFHYSASIHVSQPPFPVAGDFNGDGLDSVGVYEQYSSTWHTSNRNGLKKAIVVQQFGTPGNLPVVGNWDGGAKDGLGVYDRFSGQFLLRDAAGTTSHVLTLEYPAGTTLTGGIPVAGDFNGDGTDTVGLYYSGTAQFFLTNALWDSGTATTQAPDTFGPTGAAETLAPVMGDWNSNGKDTLGVYDRSARLFEYRNTNTSGSPHGSFTSGPGNLHHWSPVSGLWDTRGSTNEGPGWDWDTATFAEAKVSPDLIGAAQTIIDTTIPNLISLLVCRDGKLVYEYYDEEDGFDETMAGSTKSVSKSFLSALFGIMLQEGHFGSRSDSVATYIEEEIATPDPAIKIVDQMTMRAGMAWGAPGYSGFYDQSDHWVTYVYSMEFTLNHVGSLFNYSLGQTHTGYYMIQNVTGDLASEFAQEELFGPLEIEFTRWEHDPFGVDTGGYWVRPRDMARFGQLYLEGGTIQRSDLTTYNPFPAGWVADSTFPYTPPFAPNNPLPYGYGYWWRTGTFDGESGFFAWGWGGQFILVVPARELVVVTSAKWDVDQTESFEVATDILDLFDTHIVRAAIETDG